MNKITTVAFLTLISTLSHGLETIQTSEWKTEKNVIDFQPFLGEIESASYQKNGKSYRLEFVNLNTNINIWYALRVYQGNNHQNSTYYNIENSLPDTQKLSVLEGGKLEITIDDKKTTCDFLGLDSLNEGLLNQNNSAPYVELCGGLIYARNHADGFKSNSEWIKGIIRGWGGAAGESLINFAKETVYKGKFKATGKEGAASNLKESSVGAPEKARVASKKSISEHDIGLKMDGSANTSMNVGEWYKSTNFPGTHVSVMRPADVHRDILNSHKDRVSVLDLKTEKKSNSLGEKDALVVSLALNLDQYSIGWNHGTEDPGVKSKGDEKTGWSERALDKNVGRPNQLGPDGFDDIRPFLNFPGVVHPLILDKVVGTFPGGFQRKHSAFKWGDLATFNFAHHYGFMEKGVVMSTIVPNLATFIVYKDGSVDLKTWEKSDYENLSKMVDIRQNGVPIIENGIPGAYVKNWGSGNWSGDANGMLKTPRSSVCLIKNGEKNQHLILSYFTTHTPSAMARVLQSYGCHYAIHLDMNAPTLSYTALFKKLSNGNFQIEHLHDTMKPGDSPLDGKATPKSIVVPGYKDFFYIIKK